MLREISMESKDPAVSTMNPKDYKICIGLLTRNVGPWIARVLKNTERYASCFADYCVYIVDGFSTDMTQIICRSWCKVDDTRRQFAQQINPPKVRSAALVEARTQILHYFKPQFNEQTLLLLLDTDSVNAGPLDIHGFLTCFQRDDWAALFANQPTKYYDVWALRDDVCRTDYQWKYYERPRTKALLLEVEEDLKRFSAAKPVSLGFWPVRSAFGGAALYRTHMIHDAFYASIVVTSVITSDGKPGKARLPVCEHVPFNESIGRRGGKLYINCAWLISDHHEVPSAVELTEILQAKNEAVRV